MAEEKETPEINSSGITRVLEIIANKVSKKAALIAMAMILTYLLAITPTVVELLTIVGVICGLAVFGVLLQYSIDFMNAKNKRLEKINKVVKVRI